MTLLNSFISSRNFLVESFRFSTHNTMLSTQRKRLTSSLKIGMSFLSFSCLIAEVRTSSTMMNDSGENRHPCLVPDLKGKVLSFSP